MDDGLSPRGKRHSKVGKKIIDLIGAEMLADAEFTPDEVIEMLDGLRLSFVEARVRTEKK